jgi:hypothetical protein
MGSRDVLDVLEKRKSSYSYRDLNPLSVSYSYTYYVTPAPDIYYSYLKY